MERSTSRVLLCLSVLLVAFPLTLVKPGWPAGLKSDEPAYYSMALSLAWDGDLKCDTGDLRRMFAEFPYQEIHNLILATDDGWNTVYFGKPYIYSLAAAPVVRLFGASGLLAFNMALLVGMAWLGTLYLARFNPGWSAALFSFGFFFLSCGFSYVFWLHPEIFNMAGVTACLYLALAPIPDEVPSWRAWLGRPWIRFLLSGAALMPAVYNKPMLLAFALPAVLVGWRRHRVAGTGGWLVGAALSMGLVVAGSMALTGHPSAYLMARGGHKICNPDELPVQPVAPPPSVTTADGATTDEDAAQPAPAKRPRGSWFWLARIPRPHPAEVAEGLGYFLWGRHAGLLLYFPFALLSVLLFLLHDRRSPVGWSLALALASIAIFFVIWIPFNWQGGGGFVGNRYYVNAYPGFLFLVRRVVPRGVHLVGFLLGGLLIGPSLFSPFGRAVPWPTLQAHTRNFPFRLFPVELSLREVPGYDQRIWSGALVRGRSDVFLPRGARFWTHGATTTELWIQSEEPLETLVFEVASLAAPNTITLRLGDAEQRLVFARQGEGETATVVPGPQRIELAAPEPSQKRRVQDTWVWVYHLEVEADYGTVRTWERRYPAQDCFTFAYNEVIEESFFVGAEMAYLGPKHHLERDLYAVDWGTVEAPTRVAAGESFVLRTRVRNASPTTWPATPPTRVALSYRWRNTAGEVVVDNGLRTHPTGPVEPGAIFDAHQEVIAPEVPGSYVLELDLVFEMVAWFSWRNGEDVYRLPITVGPVGAPPTFADD